MQKKYLMKEKLKNPIFSIISKTAKQENIQAFVIGGFVRDLIMDRPSQDIDVVVLGSGIDFAEKVAKNIGENVKVTYFKNFGTARINWDDNEIEFVGARKESYRKDSRKPIVENGTLQDDQNRRDFTINALSLSLQESNFGELVDPFNGFQDIKNRIIRTPLDPDITFSDDPLRMMRAIRFASQLKFKISPVTFEAIRKNCKRISIVSKERIIGELNKIVLSEKPSYGFKLLDSSGLLNEFFTHLSDLKGIETVDGKSHKDNFYHTLEVLDRISVNTNDLWLRWAALLHDIAKPVTKKYDKETGWTFHGHEFMGAKMIPSIFKKLKLPLNEKMRYVQKLIMLHMRPIILSTDEVTDSAVRRLLFEAGDDIEDLMKLCDADITSKNPKKVKRFLHNFNIVRQKLVEIEEKDNVRNFQPPISGDDIINTFNLEPCREVGIIKNAIKEAILEGNLENDFDKAFEFMIREGEKLGLKRKK